MKQSRTAARLYQIVIQPEGWWRTLPILVFFMVCSSHSFPQDGAALKVSSALSESFDPAQLDTLNQLLARLAAKPVPAISKLPGEEAGMKLPGWEDVALALQQMETADFSGASRSVENALEAARQYGDVRMEMRMLDLIGDLSADVFPGTSLRAVSYYLEALTLAEQLQDTVFMLRELVVLAGHYEQARQDAAFMAYALRCARLLVRFDVPAQRISLAALFGRFLYRQGDLMRAEKMYRAALDLARRLGDPAYVHDLHWQLFWLYIGAGRADMAKAALDSVGASDPARPEEDWHEAQYHLEKLRGNREEAFRHLEQAYQSLAGAYPRRSIAPLDGWETRLRTREKEAELEAQRKLPEEQHKARVYLLGLIALVTILLFVSLTAWYLQWKSKRALIRQNRLIELQSGELQQLDQLKSHFFASISHELRTPLTLILGPIGEALKDKNLSAQGAAMLQSAERNALQLLTLVNELLDLSKLQATRVDLQEQPTVLFDFLEETVATFQPLAQGRKIDLRLEYAPDKSWTLALDRQKLLKVIHNLLGNALKFTPEGGRVVLQAGRRENEVLLEVRDTGPGIPAEYLPRIFDMYFQAPPGPPMEGGGSGVRDDSSAVGQDRVGRPPAVEGEGGSFHSGMGHQAPTPTPHGAGGGFGIGLALARELTEALGGRLWAESQPGAGAAFFLTLPVRECPPEAAEPIVWGHRHTGEFKTPEKLPAPGDMQPPPKTETTARLLVVEDNPDLQEYLRAVLPADYNLAMADNGRTALDYLESAEQVPDLILSDVMMPVMDGFQLVENLRSDGRWRSIPVILLTALAGRDDRLRAYRVGIDDYIIKPFSPEELIVRIENALHNQAARREWMEAEAVQASAAEDGPSDAWFLQLRETALENLANPQFNIDDLADRMGIGRKAMYRLLRGRTGMSANQFIQELRLLHARELLESGQFHTLRAVADAVGFRSPDYFSRLFRARFGKSPAAYL